MRDVRGVGTGAVKGEKMGADEQAGLSKAVQEVITDLKKTLFFISCLVQLAHRSSLAKVCDFSLAVPQFHTKSKSAG